MPKQDPHVEQALAEIENAERLGGDHNLMAAKKRLAAAGEKRAAAVEESEEDEADEADEADDKSTARSAAPRGRSARPTTTA